MQLLHQFPLSLLAITSTAVATCPPFASNSTPFSSSFQQPVPPTIVTAFSAHFNQHKWNLNLSHIATGTLYQSLAQGKVRADLIYHSPPTISTSIFDYKNTSSNGLLVDNTQYLYSPTLFSPPSIFRDFVLSNYPVFTSDLLVANQAVFMGVEHREKAGKVQAWGIMYQGLIPVTLYVDGCGVVMGFDYFSPGERTRVVTEFFNVVVGELGKEIFEVPK